MGQVSFRMKDERLSLIDRAAAIRGVTRTEFVLRSSEAAAIETLNERPIIELDDEAYDAFVAALDAPVTPNARLKRQLVVRGRGEDEPEPRPGLWGPRLGSLPGDRCSS